MPGITKLFEPVAIGRVTVPNRIVSTAHGTGFCSSGGEFTGRLLRYQGARAMGGAGLIVVESSYVRSPYWPTEAGLTRDDQVPGLARLVDEIHRNGARVFVQLHHAGRELRQAVAGEPPCGPSVPPDTWEPMHRVRFRYSPAEPARVLDRAGIRQLVEDFALAACRAMRAGADGVEIHGAHGYVVSHFLSTATNWRDDEYGGDAGGRTRFAVEIISRIKELAGADFVVGIRINGSDYVRGGVDPAMAADHARRLEEAGADYLNVSAGFYGSYPATILPMGEPPGIFTHLAARVKQAVGVPVITAGRINDPRLAEQVLRDGKADLVGMTRALLADPEMPLKAGRGAYAEIRRCVGCLACIDRMIDGGIRCLVNPEAGREGQVPLGRAGRKKRVLVIGAGPAGLKAAETAALRGHRVTVFEREPFPGGKLRYAAMVPTRGEMLEPVKYLEAGLENLGVKIEWDEADVETVRRLAPDAVIVATGARKLVPQHCHGGPGVCHAVDVFAQEAGVGVKVLVVGGSLIALQTADWLAERGREVTVIAPERRLLPDFYGVSLFYIRNRLGMLGVEIIKPARLHDVSGDTVTVDREGNMISIAGVETLVYTDFAPDPGLAVELSKAGFPVEVIGSAHRPGPAVDAIHQGFEAGREL